jgi:hypothetical protein
VRLGPIFSAIELESLKVTGFHATLVNAWRRRRCGTKSADDIADADKCGERLLDSGNFGAAASGLFDNHHVCFPESRLPRAAADIVERLEWMIDNRRNSRTIALLLRVYNHHLQDVVAADDHEVLQKEKVIGRSLLNLDTISKSLASLWRKQPVIASSLLAGRFGALPAATASLTGAERIRVAVLVRHMMMIWALFDLQIISYRLFHAEWNALEGGAFDDANIVTIAGMRELMVELNKVAKLARKDFEAGKDVDDVGKKLRVFIEHHELLGHAQRNAQLLGLDENDLADAETLATARKSISTYLSWLGKTMQSLINKIVAAKGERSVTATDRAKIHAKIKGASHRHEIGIPKPAATRSGKLGTLEDKRESSVERFSLPVVAAICMAVRRIIDDIGSLPIDDSILSLDLSSESKKTRLFQERTQAKITGEFIRLYRALYVRDKNHAPGLVEDYPLHLEDSEHSRHDGRQSVEPAGVIARHGEIMGAGLTPNDILTMTFEGARPSARSYAEASAVGQMIDDQRAEDKLTADNDWIDENFKGSLRSRLGSVGSQNEK